MKESVILFGTSEYSEYVYYTIKREGVLDVLGFAVNKSHYKNNEFNGLPVYVFEELAEMYDMQQCGILITVGYTKMNGFREKVYNECKKLGYRVASFISTRSICDSDDIGESCIVMPTAYVPPCTKIGVCNIINMGTYVTHTGVVGDFNWFAATIVMGGNIKMGSNCFIGMGCTLKNGISVGSNVFLGANSYLSDNAEEGLAYIGFPAENKRGLKSSIVIDFV